MEDHATHLRQQFLRREIRAFDAALAFFIAVLLAGGFLDGLSSDEEAPITIAQIQE